VRENFHSRSAPELWVLGNASYCNVLLEMTFLIRKRQKNVKKRLKYFFLFDRKCQPTLYVLIEQHKPRIKKCSFDEIFKSDGHGVL
jgi:hypothetical protein